MRRGDTALRPIPGILVAHLLACKLTFGLMVLTSPNRLNCVGL